MTASGLNLFFRFLATGASGAVLSLAITWGLTHFALGEEHYFSAYLVGITANLFFNFVMYTLAVFKTTGDHLKRLGVYLFYSSIMAFMQGATVELIVSLIGKQYYLLVIAGVIGMFAVGNFFIFKLSIFHDKEKASPMSTLAFIIVCAVLLRLAVLFHVLASAGVAPLVYGDAVGYITLAQNLWQGLGFAQTDVYGTFGPEVFRTPGLPLLLAPFAGSSLGLSFYFVLLALAGGALLPSLSYKIALRYTSHSIALLTSLFVAFEPHLVFFSILPQTEMPFMLFAYGGFLLTLHASDIRNRLYALAGGVLLGYAVLIRPGFFPILFASVLSVAVYVFCTKKLVFKKVAVVALGILLVLTPWYVRTYRVTDTVALSGAGWRNVYTDYLASIYAIENHTDFSTEKRILKDQSERAGVATEDVNNPKSANALKEYALSEIWNHKKTVIKLEAVLLTSYFIHDGYYYEFVRLHLIPPSGEAHTSSTFALLNKGFAGVGDVLHELQSQYFIPIAGRIFTVGIFLLALAGFFTARGPYRFLFALVIGLSALTATVIGLGVESRLRLPVEPLLFMFASIAIVHVSRKWKKI